MRVRRSMPAVLLLLMTTLSSGLAGGVASAATVCNKYCDARDPGLSPQDRVPVTASLSGRSIALHFDDTDAMGWASIDKAAPATRCGWTARWTAAVPGATAAAWATRPCPRGRAAGAP